MMKMFSKRDKINRYILTMLKMSNLILYSFLSDMLIVQLVDCVFEKARLAQSVERLALNQVVVGSSPTVGVSFLFFASFRTFTLTCFNIKTQVHLPLNQVIRLISTKLIQLPSQLFLSKIIKTLFKQSE